MSTDIQIKMFDDHFLVESPGTLPGLVRINNIREYHYSRNPKIVEFLNEYDFVKEFGEGIDRVYRDMATLGLPEPIFKESEFMFYATLKNKYWSKEDVSCETPEQVTPQAEKQEQDKILNFCFEPRSRKEIMDEMGYSDRKHFFNYYLKPLLESGKLIMTIPENPNSSKQKYIVKKTEDVNAI